LARETEVLGENLPQRHFVHTAILLTPVRNTCQAATPIIPPCHSTCFALLQFNYFPATLISIGAA
jgi:hypothetical protein